MSHECEHGRLRRSCDECAMAVELAELRAELKEQAEQCDEIIAGQRKETQALRAQVERLRAALGKLVTACTPIDAEPNARGEIRSVRTPEWDVVAQARAAVPTATDSREGT